MLIDANEIDDGTEIRSDVCVIGAGAAGISLALRLHDHGVDTVLLESGGPEPDDATQRLYEGRSESYFDPFVSRLRYLGGTTNHFGGQSRPLEAVDFESVPGRPGTGWPISRDEALRELPAAGEIMGLPTGEFTPDAHFGPPDATTFQAREPVEPVVFQGAAVRMGPVYRPALTRSDHVRLVTHANATKLRLDESSRVDRVEVRTLSGRRLTARAREYVLASGGLEVARILLDSDDDAPGGIGNGHDLVGRYFTDHPQVPLVPVVPAFVDGTRKALRWRIRKSAIEGLEVSAVEFLASTQAARRRGEVVGFNGSLYVDGQSFAEPAVDYDATQAAGIGDLLRMEGIEHRRRPADAPPLYTLGVGVEPLPNPESRVTLLRDRNEVGDRKVNVAWRLTDDDEHNISTAMRTLGNYLGAAGVGSVMTRPLEGRWTDLVVGGYHHLGTARMADSPRAGVVDRDLRVHGVPNLSVAGSAVFPTFGHVNPTLNLIAISLRLAERLALEVRP